MKKIIGIVIASFMFANIGVAEIKDIDIQGLKGKYVHTMCVDGYKFVTLGVDNKAGVSLVQFYEERDGKSLPAKC